MKNKIILTKNDIFKLINNNDINLIKRYLKTNNDLDFKNQYGLTPLIYAVTLNKIKIIKLFIDNNVNLEFKDDSGNTALIHAAANNQIDILNILIDKNSNIDAQNNFNHTALIKAAYWDNIESVKLLLFYGANEGLFDCDNKSFFDYLNDNNKRIILDEYPTSAYIAMFNDYKKTFSEFILEFKINKI